MTKEMLDKLLEFVEETVDRAILLHENENRHELTSCQDCWSNNIITNEIRAELLEMVEMEE